MARMVAMIPARLGSKRVKGKNLRLLAGKPLVCHVVEQCKEAGVFDDIYINSEGEVFQQIAAEQGVKFYKRDPRLAADDATNDDFALDFMDHVACSILVQVNPTSPLIRSWQIREFMAQMNREGYDAMLSLKEEQVEGFYGGKPINFDPCRKMPRSQDLEPVCLHCSCMFAWRTDAFRNNMKKYGCAVYGAAGKVGYYVFDKITAFDIDHEDDFVLTELALEALYSGRPREEPRYYGG